MPVFVKEVVVWVYCFLMTRAECEGKEVSP
jgi:hypothetical protein